MAFKKGELNIVVLPSPRPQMSGFAMTTPGNREVRYVPLEMTSAEFQAWRDTWIKITKNSPAGVMTVTARDEKNYPHRCGPLRITIAKSRRSLNAARDGMTATTFHYTPQEHLLENFLLPEEDTRLDHKKP